MKKYKDPLHVPYNDLVVMHKGKEALMLNKALLDHKNCWANLDALKYTHGVRFELHDLMADTSNVALLKLYNKLYTMVEFRLQDLWGFDRNTLFHRYWVRPGCRCPQMDNEDVYGIGCYVISGDCPMHALNQGE